jgi:hypothetical protein
MQLADFANNYGYHIRPILFLAQDEKTIRMCANKSGFSYRDVHEQQEMFIAFFKDVSMFDLYDKKYVKMSYGDGEFKYSID